MRIVFAGTPDFAAGHLLSLQEACPDNLVAVFTQPDRPAGRGQHALSSPVKSLAERKGLPIFQPITLRSDEAVSAVKELRPDLMVVVAYGLLLPRAILELPALGCINVHASLLPRWRGAAPIQRAIEAGDTQTGITIMQMDEGLDTGDSLLQHPCAIHPDDTATVLHDRLLELGKSALLEAITQLETGTAHREKQSAHGVTYAHKITKAEARLDWRLSAQQLEHKIRAFNPVPVAYFVYNDLTVRVWHACIVPDAAPALPGTVLAYNSTGLDVSTGNGVLRLQHLQLPGKKILPVNDIYNGHPQLFAVGSLLQE